MSAVSAERRVPAPAAAHATPPTDRPGRVGRLLPVLALGAVMAIAFAVLMYHGRDTTFYYDDWNFVMERQTWNADTFLRIHNEHFSAFPILIYKILFETAGLDNYWAFRAVLALFVLLCGGLMFLYARPRLGPWPAVGLAACVMLMGFGWWDLLWAFQIGFVASLAFGLAALLALERERRFWDVAAVAFLCLSLASTSLGVAFALAIGLEVAMKRQWRRLAVPGVALGLYAVWYLQYGKSTAQARNLNEAPGYVLDGVDDSMGALFGIGAEYGRILLVAVVAYAIWQLMRPGRPSPRLLAALSLPLLFFGLAGLSRAHMGVEADTGRYLFPGAVLLAIVLAETLRGHVLRGRALLALLGVLAVLVVGSTQPFAGGGDQLRASAAGVRASLTALEVVGRERAAPLLQPDQGQPQIKAFQYFTATDRWDSSPAYSVDELEGDDMSLQRKALDLGLLNAYNSSGLPLLPAPTGQERVAGAPPQVTKGDSQVRGSCRRVFAATGSVEVQVPKSGMRIDARGGSAVEIKLRRYGDEFPETAQGSVAGGGTGLVAPAPDDLPRPWTAGLSAGGDFDVCTLAG